MSALHWLHPWYLLLALAPLPLLWFRTRIRSPQRLEQFIQRHLWAQVLSTPLQGKTKTFTSFILIWWLLCIALAGPFLSKSDPQQIDATAANIVVIVDISPSMGVQDVSPSRLEHSKKLLAEFSQSLSMHRLGLIAFSANAYTVLPLSHDQQAFRHFLQQLDPSLAYVTGSNLGLALRLAQESLTTDEQTGGLVLLISDGEIHDPEALRAASKLHQTGHTLISLGVGTTQGGPVPLAAGQLLRRNGQIFTSQLQRATLEQIAQVGGGLYFDLKPDILPAITTVIKQLQQSRYQIEVDARMEQPLFPVLILLALSILFWQGLKRPHAPMLMLAGMLVFNPYPVEAAPWDEQRGWQQLQNKDYQAALQTYRQLDTYAGRMGQGAAAYGLGQWQQALDAFDRAYALSDNQQQQALATYNRGNALSQLHQIDESIAAFEHAIELQGSYPRASYNLTLLNQAKQEWGGKQNNDGEQQRPGVSESQQQTDTGAGDNNNALPLPGASEQSVRLSQTSGEQAGQRERQDAMISESLAQWSQLPEMTETPPAQAWQQYQQLKEDNQTMLRRRFEVEDKRAFGRIEEKPW